MDLDIRPGELHAIIGPNGAGKTTLMNQLCGELRSDSGTVLLGDEDVSNVSVHRRVHLGLLRSYQISSIFDAFTALENAALAAMGTRHHAFGSWRALTARDDLRERAGRALDEVGLREKSDVLAGSLSYGERRQLELAMALAAQPRLLLLDEPMAGMSAQESQAVTALLQRLKGQYTMLLIEHDMNAVFALADRISVLVYGRVLFTGTPEQVRELPEVKATYLGDESH
ncbi:ABC transporter ATP-binding protein [Cupriavidus necator]|uniref:ABC transporter ATP-binding protein n=1 Tax=Cupriavidus necator TaxID=106590 RepID=UPI003F735154